MQEIVIPLDAEKYLFRRGGITEQSVGFYGCFAPDGTCLYIGKSRQLLTRILAHWRSDFSDAKRRRIWVASGLDYRYDQRTPVAPEGSYLKVWLTDKLEDVEWELIDKLRPLYNRRGLSSLNREPFTKSYVR